MTKQTFTTGQVLTAAQMTSLQQTAMGGGSTTAKTVSYVLVAADAGTVVQMNSASATTITVNTALFAQGDTVQIQNVGAGVCTVTAGTATVNTSATLALKQYDAGQLYFNSTSAALFFAVDAADSTSPLTTKGDLYGFSTVDARLAVGTNGQVLTADSTQSTGLKYATPASGALTKIVTGTFTAVANTSTTFDGCFTSTYKNYVVVFSNVKSSAAQQLRLQLRIAGVTTATNYYGSQSIVAYNANIASTGSNNANFAIILPLNGTSDEVSGLNLTFSSVGNSSTKAIFYGNGYTLTQSSALWNGYQQETAAVYDGFILSVATGTTTGIATVYGLAN